MALVTTARDDMYFHGCNYPWSTDGTTRPIELFGILVPEVRYEKKLG